MVQRLCYTQTAYKFTQAPREGLPMDSSLARDRERFPPSAKQFFCKGFACWLLWLEAHQTDGGLAVQQQLF